MHQKQLVKCEIDRTFTFLDLEDTTVLHKASFNTFDKLYEFEKGSIIKKAYMLNYKSLHPHNLERQNVKLALRIFHVNNPAALRIGMEQQSLLIMC